MRPDKALPRGIDPGLLLTQVRGTMPYLFESEALQAFEPARVLRAYDAAPGPLSHVEYFILCASAHYASCGTPVPTDVDNQIRKKLWPRALPEGAAHEMARWVLASHGWDFTPVTARAVRGLSGHLGEWFTLACAAYAALGQYASPESARLKGEVLEAISAEVTHHSEVFGQLWRDGDGVAALKASASVAHNLGDLDRVMDLWDLSPADPLRLGFYKLGVQPLGQGRKLRYLGRLWVAGELYKSRIDTSSMAQENHRHFALRKPRCLRARQEYLTPNGPFFDAWGEVLAARLEGPDREEVIEALIQGWERLPGTLAYGRALRKLVERPGGELVQDAGKRKVLETSQEAFERRWAAEALRWMDEIPSRAG